ncbi:MAG TPA: dsRNA-specific ribonuclease [Methanoculleus sp.]|nr:dsRNA-specific ribonuclease [Methanoculleus sp.]
MTSEPDFSELERAIGYKFKDPALLERALTTKSYSNEMRHINPECKDQDGLRTLGDAVLKTVLCDHLMTMGYCTKGEITEVKSTLENGVFLAQIGEGFHLEQNIRVGEGSFEQKHQEEPHVLSETIEALVAAIYLDRNYESAKSAVVNWYEPYWARFDKKE